MGLFLFRGHAKMPILLFTLAGCTPDELFVVAVVFESLEANALVAALTPVTFLGFTIFLGGALPFRNELVKWLEADPGIFIVGCRQ